MQPTEICTQAWCGRSRRAGSVPLKAPSKLKAPTASSRSRASSSPRRVDLAGAEGQVDEGELPEDLLLLALRPAAADGHDGVGPLPLDALRVAQVAQEALVRAAPDGAGVEQDQVRVVAALGPAVPEILEQAVDALRIVRRSSGSRRWSGGSASAESLVRPRPSGAPAFQKHSACRTETRPQLSLI